jgi:hypothetical protein
LHLAHAPLSPRFARLKRAPPTHLPLATRREPLATIHFYPSLYVE